MLNALNLPPLQQWRESQKAPYYTTLKIRYNSLAACVNEKAQTITYLLHILTISERLGLEYGEFIVALSLFTNAQ